jgi:fumarylacetoacetase
MSGDEHLHDALPYLDGNDLRVTGAIDIQLEVWLETGGMRAQAQEPERLSHSTFRDSYWSVAQLVAHHTVNGCNLEAGDLLGSGTQSGPKLGEAGSLLELTLGGERPDLSVSAGMLTFCSPTC